LKTWREPVPGSTSTQPVFQHTATQSIVDNLAKFRATSTPQTRYPASQTPAQRNIPTIATYRNTPTPPQHVAASPSGQNPYAQFPTTYPPQAPTPQPQYSTPQPQLPSPPNHVDMRKLYTDIDDLTTDAKIECATHPMNTAAQSKLTTLQTLKEILESGKASPTDLVDIRKSIDAQLAKKVVQPSQPPHPIQTPNLGLPARPAYLSPQPQQQAPPIPSALPPGLNAANLADLLRATTSQNTTPQPQAYSQAYPQPNNYVKTPPIPNAVLSLPAQIPNPANSLLDQLKAAGLVSAAPTPPQGLTPPTFNMAAGSGAEPAFSLGWIKVQHSQIVTSFLSARPNQCTTCGRRFTSDETGRERKARHLDWHFKTKARMLDAEKRGQNRSWYVDVRTWIKSKEVDDEIVDDTPASANTSPIKKQQQDFVRAPNDPVLRSMRCPIDQEPFNSEWSEEVQDWIWKDTVLVGGRYYHASCYREVTKDRDRDAGNTTPLGAGLRTSTPDSVLGKRKAEQEANGATSRVKLEA
jgi:pre-mRNA cleavage complex 2 protein Pcf11